MMPPPPPPPPQARKKLNWPVVLSSGFLAGFLLYGLIIAHPKKERADTLREAEEVADKEAEMREAIANKKIKIGMTKRQCIAAWGLPENVNRTVTENHKREQWVYGSGNYVYFVDGKLTSWQDSIGR